MSLKQIREAAAELKTQQARVDNGLKLLRQDMIAENEKRVVEMNLGNKFIDLIEKYYPVQQCKVESNAEFVIINTNGVKYDRSKCTTCVKYSPYTEGKYMDILVLATGEEDEPDFVSSAMMAELTEYFLWLEKELAK